MVSAPGSSAPVDVVPDEHVQCSSHVVAVQGGESVFKNVAGSHNPAKAED